MMIARKLWVSQLLVLLVALPASAQYKNPRYRDSGQAPAKTLPTNKKTPVTESSGSELSVPNYSSDSSATSTTPYASSPQHTTSTTSSEHTMEMAVNADIPVVLGEAGQGLKPKFGFNAQMYLAPMLDPAIHNYISIGYESFSIAADSNASFRFVPITLGLEWRGVTDSFLKPMFGIGLGGVYAFVYATDAQIFNGKLYFMGQVKGGFSIDVTDSVAVQFQTPVNFVLGSTKMSYLSYNLGVRFGL